MRGRRVRLDARGRVVWNIPAMVPIEDFSEPDTLIWDVGAEMRQVTARWRDRVPDWALLFWEVSEYAICSGPSEHPGARAGQSPCQVRDWLSRQGLLCSHDAIGFGCSECSLRWHGACAAPCARAWGLDPERLEFDRAFAKPQQELVPCPPVEASPPAYVHACD
eukprot:4774089-Pyramimonas_sp.AAC.1